MQKEYIPAANAYRKLQFAEGSNAAVYVYGATGYGKTRLVQEYLDGREALRLSPMELEWELSALDEPRQDGSVRCVVVDDLQLLRDEEQKRTLLALARREDVWLVMLGRMQTPLWLAPLVTEGRMVVIPEENLHLSADEIRRIAEWEQLSISTETAEMFAANGQGNAYAIISIIKLMKSGEMLDDDLQSRIRDEFVAHLEKNIIPQWDIRLQEFLMQVSVVDEFTLPLAVMITGDNRASAMLDQALAAGNFLQQDGEVYRIRPQLIAALRARALKVFGVQKYAQCTNNAGLYFETQGDYLTAIRLYEASGNQNGIRSLLIRSARRHPGTGNLYDLRRYYLTLTEAEAETSPMLMSVMSMLYSIMMNPERSEYWYDKLKAYAASAKGGERREADEQLLYLDIALPHRGDVNMLELLKRAAGLLKSGGMALPELSMTNNQPGVMNGGKDFCDWSRHDQLLADTVGKMVEKLLGDFGRGLVHTALCESFYEKGGRDEEVLHHAIMAQMDIDSGGKTELLFAPVGIQVRLNLLSGNPVNAVKLLNSFENRVHNEKLQHLLPNLRALRCRVALVTGDLAAAEDWLAEAPDEHMEFWTLDRYRYLTKVRCYLALGQNQDALDLLERLLYYAEVSGRTYIRMESRLLKAIALRGEKREWKPVLLQALNEAQSYDFVRIVSEKGAGILPLLKAVRRDYLAQKQADGAWFERTLQETEQLAERYPGYLLCDAAQPKDFCETALTVLKLQSDGYSFKEIAAKLELSERTVKYHAAENYRKLGAKGKTDAVQIARSRNLI